MAEKILFVKDVWDSIASKERVPMPESHKTELDWRFAKYQNRSGQLFSLKELQTRIRRRKKSDKKGNVHFLHIAFSGKSVEFLKSRWGDLNFRT